MTLQTVNAISRDSVVMKRLAKYLAQHCFRNTFLEDLPLPEALRANLSSKNPVSIFKAVEQLGLNLEAATAKLRVMVIQKVDRRPEEN